MFSKNKTPTPDNNKKEELVRDKENVSQFKKTKSQSNPLNLNQTIDASSVYEEHTGYIGRDQNLIDERLKQVHIPIKHKKDKEMYTDNKFSIDNGSKPLRQISEAPSNLGQQKFESYQIDQNQSFQDDKSSDSNENDNTSNSAKSDQIDEEFFKKHCTDFEINEVIDKKMIIDFVKNAQFFARIQIIFDLQEPEKLKLYSLYQQATKGDLDETAYKGFYSLFSGPNKQELEAWKKRKGTPREEAMHRWVSEVKKLTDPLYLNDLFEKIKNEQKIKEKDKPQIKSIKQFQSYLEHFLVIYREYRYFTRSIRTETLQSITRSINLDESDGGSPMQRKITTVIDKKLEQPFRLQKPSKIILELDGAMIAKNQQANKVLNTIDEIKKIVIKKNQEEEER